jgi:DNA-binding LacI/PurR family transcriptional regulator
MPPEPSAPPVRMVDIARKAGVSRMAVSAVLMGTGAGRVRVSTQTAERIRTIAQESGFRPNPAAQQLAGRSSGIIAVVANNWKNFLTQHALAWLHDAAAKAGTRVMAQFCQSDVAPIRSLIRDIHSGWIDGVVYLAYENESQWPELADVFRSLPSAVVAIGDLCDPTISSVISDVTSGARATIAHLHERGRWNPVFISEETESAAFQQRRQAYIEAADELGVVFNDARIVIETRGWLVSDAAYYPRFDALARRVVETMKADSVICDSDFTACGLIRALRRLHIRCPQDVSVIGWGNLPFSGLFDPPITTVSLELPTLLTRAVERLQRAKQKLPHETIERVETRLVVRESSH